MENNNITTSKKTSLMRTNISKRRRWTQDETKLFLKCFLQRQHEFRSRKKKFAYKKVLKDMIANGFNDKTVRHSNLESKMRTLSHAYMACKDEIFPKKASVLIKPFIEELDIIFGNQFNFITPQPTTNNSEQNLFVKSENDLDDDEADSSSQSDIGDPLNATHIETTSNLIEDELQQETKKPDVDIDVNVSENETHNRNNAQHEYYEAKLEFKRRNLALKAKYYNDMLAMEKQKLELLTKIADKLCKS